MARKKIVSAYKEQVNTYSLADSIDRMIFEEILVEDGFYFQVKPNIKEILKNKIKELDFNDYDYITYYGKVYWCGILYALPFDELVQSKKINPNQNGWDSCEGYLLNLIKDHHIILDDELNIKFVNPTSSPLYRFFNKYKTDCYGGNVSASLNSLIFKIATYLEEDFSNNMDKYGEWILEDETEAC